MVKRIMISIPLKHPEDTYTFTYDPDFPGPFMIEITSSPLQLHMLSNNDNDITLIARKEPLPIVTIPLHLPITGRKEETLSATMRKHSREHMEYDDSPMESDDENPLIQCFKKLWESAKSTSSSKKATISETSSGPSTSDVQMGSTSHKENQPPK
ncbi:hypothetical protein JVU11DRAFT_11454 [Chiua virens]|nr:hypothetical protein JVU11DRAFT_11454 [Chiua virens]